MNDAYVLAQEAMAKLRIAVHVILESAPEGLTNARIGRSLGIYPGHVGHEGHIPRTILALMEAEGTVEQDGDTKLWTLRTAEPNLSDAEST
jgi:hypothetical protein